MDFLALYLTSRLCNYPRRTLRLTSAALIGSISALASAVISTYRGDISPILEGAFMIITALLLSAIAFGLTAAPRTALTFIAVNMGLGGCMTALYSFFGKLSISGNIPSSDGISQNSMSPLIFMIIAAVSGAVSLVYTHIRKKQANRRSVSAKMTVFGTETTFKLMCDSGDLLLDPFGKKPVIILSADYFKDKLPGKIIEAARSPDAMSGLPDEYARAVRLIPASGVLGKGLLVGFIPERIEADGVVIDAVAALDASDNDYGGCAGIIPLSLITK